MTRCNVHCFAWIVDQVIQLVLCRGHGPVVGSWASLAHVVNQLVAIVSERGLLPKLEANRLGTLSHPAGNERQLSVISRVSPAEIIRHHQDDIGTLSCMHP